MSKYDLRGSQIGAVGENAESHNNSFTMNASNTDTVVDEIVKELNEIYQIIIKRDNIPRDEETLLKHIEELKQIREKDKLVSSIRTKATGLFYNLSTGVGSGVVANIIYKVING